MLESEKIAVIGGGAVGLELVGELAVDFPNKKILLLHGREQILDDRMAPKFLKKINDGLKALKVQTVLGEKVNMDDLNVSQDNTSLLLYWKAELEFLNQEDTPLFSPVTVVYMLTQRSVLAPLFTPLAQI